MRDMCTMLRSRSQVHQPHRCRALLSVVISTCTRPPVKDMPTCAFTFKEVLMGSCLCLQPGDKLIWVARCTKSDSLLLANSEGRSIRFCADDSQVCVLSLNVAGCGVPADAGCCTASPVASQYGFWAFEDCTKLPHTRECHAAPPFCPRSSAGALLAAALRMISIIMHPNKGASNLAQTQP